MTYRDDIIKSFIIASLFWLVTGLSIGLFIASQLAYPELNFNEYSNFGRIRPMHTTAIILGFAANILFATSFFVVQRTCRVSLWGSKKLHYFIFWAYQIFLILALTGYPLGITKSQEYAEFEWYSVLVLVPAWICYILVFFMTLKNRKEPHIYVANWFYLSYIITVIVLFLGNNLSLPIWFGATKSYQVFSGVQNAMIQWWYGHNIVGFMLTAGFIGIMYYFIPKRANRPVYSYRLSILHFWSLIFLYIWAGPHHLHYTSLPSWVQTLGMTFSIMLWMPSWGGMINGIMTLSGVWYKLREDPVLCFFIIAVSFYGMSTFEGPLLAIKEVNSLGHYTDWIIGHVHSGALGWVAFMAFGALYHIVPILWKREKLYSVKLASLHLWIASTGIVLYITAMWVSGIMQGLMWRAYDNFGFLQYSFIESVIAIHPMYILRALGGLLFLTGALIMVYNLVQTIRGESEPEKLSYAKA